jgi:hypothetical protein
LLQGAARIGGVIFHLRLDENHGLGWKSPIYCDNRLSLSYPEVRTYIKNALSEAIRTHFPAVEIIAGVATAGSTAFVSVPEGVYPDRPQSPPPRPADPEAAAAAVVQAKQKLATAKPSVSPSSWTICSTFGTWEKQWRQ